MIDETTRKNAVNDVKNGMSYLQSAKKHGIGCDSVKRWCYDVDVHSSFPSGRRKTDEEVLEVIAAHGVLTCREMSKFLECEYVGLSRRLQYMVKKGKIQSFRIPRPSHAARIRGLFRKYSNTRIYYVSKDDLAKWVRDQLPDEPSMSLRKYVTHIFRSIDTQIFKEAKK